MMPNLTSASCFGESLQVRVSFKGWDSYKERMEMTNFVNKMIKDIKYIELICSFDKMVSDSTLRCNIQSLEKIASELEDRFLEKISLALNEKISLIPIQEIKEDFNELRGIFQHAYSETGEPLQFDQLDASVRILRLMSDYYDLFYRVNFFNRNKSLAKNLELSAEKNKKIWCIAGKLHLWNGKNKKYKETVEYLHNALKGKKYVILVPNKAKVIYQAKSLCSRIWTVASILLNCYFESMRDFFLESKNEDIEETSPDNIIKMLDNHYRVQVKVMAKLRELLENELKPVASS